MNANAKCCAWKLKPSLNLTKVANLSHYHSQKAIMQVLPIDISSHSKVSYFNDYTTVVEPIVVVFQLEDAIIYEVIHITSIYFSLAGEKTVSSGDISMNKVILLQILTSSCNI